MFLHISISGLDVMALRQFFPLIKQSNFVLKSLYQIHMIVVDVYPLSAPHKTWLSVQISSSRSLNLKIKLYCSYRLIYMI